MATLKENLNRVAGTSGLGEAGAANIWAGTSGLGLEGALNVKATTTGLGLKGVCAVLAAEDPGRGEDYYSDSFVA